MKESISNEKLARLWHILIVLPGVIGVVIITGNVADFIIAMFNIPYWLVFQISILFILMSILSMAVLYLQTGFKSKNNMTGDVVQNIVINKDAKEIDDKNMDNMTPQEKQKYAYDTEVEKHHINNAIFTGIAEVKNRLLMEITSLSRKGNLNLAIGGITACFGIFIFGSTVMQASDAMRIYISDMNNSNIAINNQSYTSSKEFFFMIKDFSAKLTLVFFIELFAFFFLRLYKQSLNEIKFFQNELTNIESKNIALLSAINLSDKSIIKEVILKIVNTERNRILEKGQTTSDIELSKIEKTNMEHIAKHLTALLSKEK